MRIINTNLNDVDRNNLDIEKIKIGEKIIESVTPLLEDSYSEKSDRTKRMIKEVNQTKQKVTENKDVIRKLMKKYEREKKIGRILSEISKIISSGSVRGHMKNELIILLKTLDKITDSKLESHLSQLQRSVRKRFA